MLVAQKKILTLPKWIIIWLIFSMLIVFWDVLFVLLRPASFPGGALQSFWLPYAQYIKIDTSYADMDDNFVIAQALMSLAEICIGFIALYFSYKGKNSAAILFAFSALLLTGTKTILIFLVEMVANFKHIQHNPMTDLFLFYILPNSLWIIIPFCAVFLLGQQLIAQLNCHHT